MIDFLLRVLFNLPPWAFWGVVLGALWLAVKFIYAEITYDPARVVAEQRRWSGYPPVTEE